MTDEEALAEMERVADDICRILNSGADPRVVLGALQVMTVAVDVPSSPLDKLRIN